MVRRKILIVTSLVLVGVSADEGRAQRCGCTTDYVPAGCYVTCCNPYGASWGHAVYVAPSWANHQRSACRTYVDTPCVYPSMPMYCRYGTLTAPRSVARPLMSRPPGPVAKMSSPPIPDREVAPPVPEAPDVWTAARDIKSARRKWGAVDTSRTLPAPPTPPELQDMIETARNVGQLNTLLEFADLAQLLEEARAGGPYTIVAPSDEAFALLPANELELLKANKNLLRQVVLHHVISDVKLTVAELALHSTVTPLTGPELTITKEASAVRVDGATISQGDIECVRAMIHVIDRVLIPPDVLSTIQETKQ